MEEAVERRLTTILFADVAAYSRRMEKDEEGTLSSLVRCRATIDGLIREQRGRIANTAGDAVLAFMNLSSDPEQEFLGDGIAEDVITARNSSFTDKGRAGDFAMGCVRSGKKAEGGCPILRSKGLFGASFAASTRPGAGLSPGPSLPPPSSSTANAFPPASREFSTIRRR
jgi:hypothetical protein